MSFFDQNRNKTLSQNYVQELLNDDLFTSLYLPG